MNLERIRTDDIELCYSRAGSGPPLVMLMGLTANTDWWAPALVDRLACDFSLLMFDNRGAGRSSTGMRPFSVKQFADDTAGLMRGLGIERAHVIGVSMGGMIAQELALRWPGLVDRLVLCCTSCGGIHSTLPRFQAMKVLFRPRSDDVVEQALRSVPVLFPEPWLTEHPEIREQFAESVSQAPISRQNAQRQIRAVGRFNTYRRLPFIKQQTLVLCGLQDVILPPENSLVIARRIPGARLEVFEGAGHGFTSQCAEAVGDTASRFLNAT